MKKQDCLSFLMAHGQGFAIGFLVVISLAISTVIFLLVVFAAATFNKIFG